VLWIADEVQCGMGRSGRFFAFEHHGVVPDVTALAKALGGSKTAMAAMIARREVFMKAYGVPKKALVHAPATFGGIGEGCATSIEALNILYDENLIENAAEQGDYLLMRLKALVTKYPGLLKEARGQGLMIGVEFNDISQALPFGLKQMVALLDDKLKGSLCGFFGALMLAQKDMLVAFTEYNRNVIRLEPPLTITRAHADAFVDAFDEVLSRGVVGIVKGYLALKVAG
jgi:acetylornithine/succinyldiaminopimelate/putrescine aminotransferase